MEGKPAVSVKIRDASTGAFIAGGTTLELRLGGTTVARQTFPDSRIADDEELNAGDEAGRYDVVIRKAGYAEWRRTGINVEDSGDCAHRPVTVRLEALLTRAP